MTDSNSSTPNKKTSKIIALVCVVVIIVVGLALVLKGNDPAPASNSQSSEGQASFYVSPDTQSVAKGQQLSINVWANSGSKSINTVEADLSYAADYFDFVGVEGTNSSFPYGVQGDAKDGVITIVRGTTNPVKSNSLVAVIKLQAKDKAGSTKISFTKDSKIFAKGGTKNILSKTTAGKYTIK